MEQGSLALFSARNDSRLDEQLHSLILERCIQSAVTTMWGIPLAGSRISLPILFGHQFSEHISFFSHYLLILYHTLSALSSVYYNVSGVCRRERNRTSPNQWIPSQYSFLPAGDLIEKISHPLPRRQGRFQRGSQVPLSSYIYYYTVNPTKSQGFINLF